jgi:hypothetical protein
VPEWPRARIVQHPPQVVVVVLQRLLAHNDIPATGKGGEHKTGRARLVELELDGVGVTYVNLAHRRKQRRTRDTHTLRRPDDAGMRGLDVLGGEIGAVVEFHPLAQKERIRFAIRRDLPAMCQVGDNRLPAVQRITSDQIVVHTALRAHIIHGARLMDIKVRGRTRDAIP